MENKKQTHKANSSMEKTNHGGSHVQSGHVQKDVAGSHKGVSSAHKGMGSEKAGHKGACSDKECAPTKGASSHKNGSGTEYKK